MSDEDRWGRWWGGGKDRERKGRKMRNKNNVFSIRTIWSGIPAEISWGRSTPCLSMPRTPWGHHESSPQKSDMLQGLPRGQNQTVTKSNVTLINEQIHSLTRTCSWLGNSTNTNKDQFVVCSLSGLTGSCDIFEGVAQDTQLVKLNCEANWRVKYYLPCGGMLEYNTQTWIATGYMKRTTIST